MDLVNLARGGHASPTDVIVAVSAPLVSVGLIGWAIYATTRRVRWGLKFDGPALTGTAQVLSVNSNFSLWSAMWSYHLMGYRIGLRVAVPGYPVYDVTVETRGDIYRTSLGWAQVGRTIAVQVDSANLQKVRVDLSRPVGAPPGWYPDPSGQPVQRYFDGRQWTVSVQRPPH
jgi:hypothetical protein